MEPGVSEPLERPATALAADPLNPRGPWAFLKTSLPGGFSTWGIQFMLAWMLMPVLGSISWALHLRGHVGHSALPNHWGEMLSAREAWELAVNGRLGLHPMGTMSSLLLGALVVWMLWSGWKLQATSVGQDGRFQSWLWGLGDALLIGVLPISAVVWLLLALLHWLGASGLQSLGWLDVVGTPVVCFVGGAAFMVQWWLCRLQRDVCGGGWRIGSWRSLGTHFWRSSVRLWGHPVQWGLLLLTGVLLRSGLMFIALRVTWSMGGASSLKVWISLLLLTVATGINGWMLGWLLRLTACYWRHDVQVQTEICALETLVQSDERV